MSEAAKMPRTKTRSRSAKSGLSAKAATTSAVVHGRDGRIRSAESYGRVMMKDEKGATRTYALPPGGSAKVLDLMTSLKAREIESHESVSAEEVFAPIIEKTGSAATLIRGYRTRDGLSQDELAAKLGTTRTNVSAMESGRRAIGKAMAKRLAEIFETDYRNFL
jgi:DNA-binding XRE family transcriptional regulator